MTWPGNKKIAFSLITEPDFCTSELVNPIEDFLIDNGILFTKTVWVYPPNNHYTGEYLTNNDHMLRVKELQENGIEIGLHNVGSGTFNRSSILEGIELFHKIIGHYPRIQLNHSNPDNIYWGSKRFIFPLSFIYGLFSKRKFEGNQPKSEYFWGDELKSKVKYLVWLNFTTVFTSLMNKYTVCKDTSKQYANYLVNVVELKSCEEIASVINRKTLNKLNESNGTLIICTNFSKGFYNETDQSINPKLKDAISLLKQYDMWHTTSTSIFDHIVNSEKATPLSFPDKIKLNIYWLFDKLIYKK
jgi:hypothetical protein